MFFVEESKKRKFEGDSNDGRALAPVKFPENHEQEDTQKMTLL